MAPTNEAIDRYLKIARWAQRRYTKSGWLVIRIGERLCAEGRAVAPLRRGATDDQ